MRAVVRPKTLEFRKIITSVDVQGNDLKIIFKLGQIMMGCLLIQYSKGQ